MKLLLAHGSSDSTHGEQVRALAKNVSDIINEEVAAGFLSDAKLPAGAMVLPLFLGAGQHLTEDVPKLIAASKCAMLPSLNAYSDHLVALAFDALTKESKRINTLFALYRFTGFEAMTAAIHAANKRCSLVGMGSMHSEPSITSLLDLWHGDGVRPITVQPMLLFAGHSLARVADMIDQSNAEQVQLAPVLSELPGFAQLIAEALRALHATR